jgi:hypothetical protein
MGRYIIGRYIVGRYIVGRYIVGRYIVGWYIIFLWKSIYIFRYIFFCLSVCKYFCLSVSLSANLKLCLVSRQVFASVCVVFISVARAIRAIRVCPNATARKGVLVNQALLCLRRQPLRASKGHRRQLMNENIYMAPRKNDFHAHFKASEKPLSVERTLETWST